MFNGLLQQAYTFHSMFLQDILFNFVAEMFLIVCVLFWQQLNMLANVSTPGGHDKINSILGLQMICR
jgi:hypothetical protein